MRMMLTVAVLGLITAGAARADCMPPNDSVQIPDGSKATRDEMIAAQRAIKAFDAAVQTYGDCLKQEQDAKIAAGGDRGKVTAAYSKLNNEQVDKVQKYADKFNVELRAFKAKSPG